jgi:hypothetical protein
MAGSAVPRKVLDIPRKLIETKAPEAIIHLFSAILTMFLLCVLDH